MVKPLFVAAADLHFDEHGPWRYKGIIGDAAYGLSQVVDYCIAQRPAGLWLLGDLMNRPTPRTQAVREFYDQMDRCREAQVPVYYVLGDHDGRQDWPGLHPWPVRADGEEVHVGKLLGMGLSYLPAGALQAALVTIPEGIQIFFTHQKWAEFVGHSAQGKLTQVPDYVPYIVTGDYHKQVEGELDDGRRVWSPGSLTATSVADDNPRMFLVGYSGPNNSLECEFVPIKSRLIRRVRVESADEAAHLVGPGIESILADVEALCLPVQVSKPIVDVEYFTDIPGIYELLEPLSRHCFFFPRPRDRARTRKAEIGARQGSVISLEEAIGRLAAPGTPGYDWTLRLLSAGDREIEWRAIAEEVQHARQNQLSG
jgi:hypothetical protein